MKLSKERDWPFSILMTVLLLLTLVLILLDPSCTRRSDHPGSWVRSLR